MAVFEENFVELEAIAAHPGPQTLQQLWRRLIDLTVETSAFVEMAVDARRTMADYEGAGRLRALVEAALPPTRVAGTVNADITIDDVLLAHRMVYGVVLTTPDPSHVREGVEQAELLLRRQLNLERYPRGVVRQAAAGWRRAQAVSSSWAVRWRRQPGEDAGEAVGRAAGELGGASLREREGRRSRPHRALSQRRLALTYSPRGFDLTKVGFTPAPRTDATLRLVVPRDTSIWPHPVDDLTPKLAPKAPYPLADPVQVIWDILDEGGVDADRAAAAVRRSFTEVRTALG